MQKRILIWAVAAVVVFLLGFIPMYSRSARLGSELRQSEERCDRLELRDLAGRMYIQAFEKNFGLAAQTASRFFTLVRQQAGKTEDAGSRKQLEDISGYRDRIMVGLGKGEPAILDPLQEVYAKTIAATER